MLATATRPRYTTLFPAIRIFLRGPLATSPFYHLRRTRFQVDKLDCLLMERGPRFMPSTMQAVVKAQAAPGIEIREVPVPSPGPGEVLVRVTAASVCGTDLHIFDWNPWAQSRIHPPLIPGHEFAGAVAAVGRGVTTVKEGDLVSAEMHVACGKCLQCRTGLAHVCQHVRILGVDADGAFASYAVIPEKNIWKLSPAIPHEWA